MTTFVPRTPYSKEELAQLYPQELELQLVQVVSTFKQKGTWQDSLIRLHTDMSEVTSPWFVLQLQVTLEDHES